MNTNERSVLDRATNLILATQLFRGLGQQQRAQLAARIRLRRFREGEAIFSVGDSGASLMGVVDGSVQISVPSADGKEIILTIMLPGDILGEISVLDARERSADARAITACTLAVLDSRDVMRAYTECPQAYVEVVQFLCERIRRTTTQVAEVTLLNLPSRLSRALLRAATAQLRNGRDAPGDLVKLSQRELGNLVGATRESVNKCLGVWQRNSIVEVNSAGIKILNRRALVDIADLSDQY